MFEVQLAVGFLPIFFIVLAVLLVGGTVGMFIFLNPIAKKVYEEQVVRTSPEKFGNDCTYQDNEEQVRMWKEGLAFADTIKEKKQPIDITNDGLKLHAEYYDQGSDRCVIVIPGRAEGLMYGYYFDQPYWAVGMNILAVDPRSHGSSEGRYHSLGHYEHRDLDKWITWLEEKHGIRKVYLHCICVGTVTGLLMAINGSKRSNVKGIITEGAFYHFKETFKEHIKYEGKPVYPFLPMCLYHIQKNTGARLNEEAPIKLVKQLNDMPILFLYGREDMFSLPHLSQKLYDECSSVRKKIVWFDKGAHSHLRINNQEAYDNAIKEFVG